jgi:hypothetical protein
MRRPGRKDPESSLTMRSAVRISEDRTTGPFQNCREESPRRTLDRRESHPVVVLVLRQESDKNGRADCSRKWPHDSRTLCTRRAVPVSRHQVELDSGVLRHGINRTDVGLQPTCLYLRLRHRRRVIESSYSGPEPRTHRWGYGQGELRQGQGGERIGRPARHSGTAPSLQDSMASAGSGEVLRGYSNKPLLQSPKK